MIPFPRSASPRSVSLDVDRFPLPLLGMAVMVAVTCLIVLGLRAPQVPVVLTAAADFHSRIDQYVELRQRIESTMAALRVTTDPAEILERQRGLGAAIQAARSGAHQGQIFSRAAGNDFHRMIAADLTRRSAGDQAALMAEVPPGLPRVNERYPTMSPLATFPALLLAALPRLPEDLEYRFLGRYLIIRDAKTNLIVDYLVVDEGLTVAGGS